MAPRHVGLAALLPLLLVALVATAQPAPDLAEARAAALEQLEAFRKGDFDAAYRFASTEIHEQFDRERFEQMVRGGYPEIARSATAVVDGSERAPNGHVFLFLHIRGANGKAVQAIYEMVSEDGRWKVNGVVTRPDTSESA
jgi:ABC-type transporter MlaC component